MIPRSKCATSPTPAATCGAATTSNEVNIFENGFLRRVPQRAAQPADQSGGRRERASPTPACPGQAATPIFDAAFGARGGQAALPRGAATPTARSSPCCSRARRAASPTPWPATPSTCAAWSATTCALCGRLGYSAGGAYPINFFQVNPYAAGQPARILTDEARSNYQSLQIQFRQRYRGGLT